MKYKKYILILLITLFIGCNNAYAVEEKKCYYIADDFKASLYIRGGNTEVSIDKKGTEVEKNKEGIKNWYTTNPFASTKKSIGGTKFEYYYKTGDKLENISCPKYLVFQACGLSGESLFTGNVGYEIYGAEDSSLVQSASLAINNKNKCQGFYASYQSSNGNPYTANDYYGVSTDVETGGTDVDVTCDTLFDAELKGIINEILGYVRIIVPILVILLGTLDLAKAVLAGKEDEMRKAQKTFIMRLIAGVAVFFVPLLVDIVMELANIVWEGLGYSSCNNF